MKAISIFNRYLVPVLFLVIIASVLSACHVLPQPRGHEYRRDNHHAQPGRHLENSQKAKHRANRY